MQITHGLKLLYNTVQGIKALDNIITYNRDYNKSKANKNLYNSTGFIDTQSE